MGIGTFNVFMLILGFMKTLCFLKGELHGYVRVVNMIRDDCSYNLFSLLYLCLLNCFE